MRGPARRRALDRALNRDRDLISRNNPTDSIRDNGHRPAAGCHSPLSPWIGGGLRLTSVAGGNGGAGPPARDVPGGERASE